MAQCQLLAATCLAVRLNMMQHGKQLLLLHQFRSYKTAKDISHPCFPSEICLGSHLALEAIHMTRPKPFSRAYPYVSICSPFGKRFMVPSAKEVARRLFCTTTEKKVTTIEDAFHGLFRSVGEEEEVYSWLKSFGLNRDSLAGLEFKTVEKFVEHGLSIRQQYLVSTAIARSQLGTIGITPVVIRKAPGERCNVNFKSRENFQQYMNNNGLSALMLPPSVPGQLPEEVSDLADLVPNAEYVPVPKKDQTQVSNIQSHVDHLTRRREGEFEESLLRAAAALEGVDSSRVKKRDDLHVINDSSGKVQEVELDAVIEVQKDDPVLYIGCTKTSCHGTYEVNSLLGVVKAIELQILAQNARYMGFKGFTLKAVFMAEFISPSEKQQVKGYCKNNNVLVMERTHGSIAPAL